MADIANKTAFKNIQLVKNFGENVKTNFENDVLYLVRTNAEGTHGYVQMNGKKYGDIDTLKSELINSAITYTDFKAVEDFINGLDASQVAYGNAALGSGVTNVNGALDALVSKDANSVKDVKVGGNSIVDANKVANLAVEGTYAATGENTNKIATESTVKNAIDALDVTETTVGDNNVQITYSESNGKVSISVKKDDSINATDLSTAINALDYNLTDNANLVTVDGNVIKIATTIKEENGIISVSETQQALAAVAKTGAASDVTFTKDATSELTSTNVNAAILELEDKLDGDEVTIADGEKILAFADDKKELSSTLTIDIEKQGEGDEAVEYIVLKGKNGAEVSKVDASAFVKDGMIDSVEWKKSGETETSVLVITWNTDAGKTATEVDMSKFIDTYTSGNATALTVDGYVITPNTGAVAENAGTLTTGGQVYTAIAATKGQDIQTITGETALENSDKTLVNVAVTATKGANDDNNYTLSSTVNVTSVNVSAATASNDGIALAKDVKDYVDAKVGTAVQSVKTSATENAKSVTQSDYAVVKITSTTDSGNNVTLSSEVGLTIKAITGATGDNKGLAEASDVKTYVDGKITDLNKTSTEVANKVLVGVSETNGIVDSTATALVVNGVEFARAVNATAMTATITGADVAAGALTNVPTGHTDITSASTINTVLSDIYATLGAQELVSSDKTITVGTSAGKTDVVVNRETASAATVGDGHIEIAANSTSGAMYGVMYYGGDDFDE